MALPGAGHQQPLSAAGRHEMDESQHLGADSSQPPASVHLRQSSGGGERASSPLVRQSVWKWSFKGDAELKVRQYNPIYPFTFKASFFNYLLLSRFC